MLKFGNKEFRNLQQQVHKNQHDIANIRASGVVLDEFGIKVIGQVDDESDLPSGSFEFGDAYAVGTETPYELYIWTRTDESGEHGYWFNIGTFPMPGPQGPAGEDGPQGEQGPEGQPGATGADAGFGVISAEALTLNPGSSATATVTASGPDTEKSFSFTFGIPRGADGQSAEMEIIDISSYSVGDTLPDSIFNKLGPSHPETLLKYQGDVLYYNGGQSSNYYYDQIPFQNVNYDTDTLVDMRMVKISQSTKQIVTNNRESFVFIKDLSNSATAGTYVYKIVKPSSGSRTYGWAEESSQIDGKTIIEGQNGLETAIGGWLQTDAESADATHFAWGDSPYSSDENYLNNNNSDDCTAFMSLLDSLIGRSVTVKIYVEKSGTTYETEWVINNVSKTDTYFRFYSPGSIRYGTSQTQNIGYLEVSSTLIYLFAFAPPFNDMKSSGATVTKITLITPAETTYHTIDGRYVPIDGTTIQLNSSNKLKGFSGNYNDLTNKPTIPTVNNATLTIQKNGTTVKTFTANASSNVTANITVPTKTSEITNNSGFITKDVNNLTNYTKTSSLASVATSGDYGDLLNTPDLSIYETAADASNIAQAASNAANAAQAAHNAANDAASDAANAASAAQSAHNAANDAQNTANAAYDAVNAIDLTPYATIDALNAVSSDATNAANAASNAQSTANSAYDAANSAASDAANAQATANDAVNSIAGLATVATTGDYDDLLNKPTLFSGSYNDLTDKPDLSVYELASDAANIAIIANNAANDASSALSAASDAVNAATAASSSANNAVSTANQAASDATNAVNSATDAVNAANSASSAAASAVNTANAAASDASNAVQAANDAGNVAQSALDAVNAIHVPTDVSELNNDAGYITGIDSSDVTTALGYTPYSNANPDGYISGITDAMVIAALGYTPGTSNFSGSYNDLTDKPTIPQGVDIISVSGSSGTLSSADLARVVSSPETVLILRSNNYYRLNVIVNSHTYNYVWMTSSSGKTYRRSIAIADSTGAWTFTEETLTIPTKTSDLTNDSGFITGVTWNDVSNKPTFATVATSGDYDDLIDKPDLSVYELAADAANIAQAASDAANAAQAAHNAANDAANDAANAASVAQSAYNAANDATIEVIELSGFIGTLTSAQLTKMNAAPNKIALKRDTVYLSYSATGTSNHRYTSVAQYTDSIAGYTITVNKTTGAWTYSSDSISDSSATAQDAYNAANSAANDAANAASVAQSAYNAANDANSAIAGLATVATTGDYDDLIDKPNIYYHNGDKFIIRNNFNVTGYMTSAGKFIGFMIAVPKLLTNISSVTINKLSCIFRGIGGYVNGSAYIDYANTTGYTVAAQISEDNQVYIGITATNAYSSGNNNTPINIQAVAAGIELTFNA